MKNVLIVLVLVFVFSVCAVLGYTLAEYLNGSGGKGAPWTGSGTPSNQHNLIIILVDSLESPRPALISTWFVSLYFVENSSPELAFGQIYFQESKTRLSQALGKSFVLQDGKPSDNFWKALQAARIAWEGYVLVDLHGASRVLGWVFGPNYPVEDILLMLTDHQENERLVTLVCQSFAEVPDRPAPDFAWSELAPGHFRTSLNLEDGLLYWEKTTRSGPLGDCRSLPSR